METGRPIHYKGNTLAPPAPGKKTLYRRRTSVRDQGTIISNDKIPQYEAKTVASLQCVWCGAPQEDYRIRCRSCGNCQYCGLLIDSDKGCRFCGNHVDRDLEARLPAPTPRRHFGASGGRSRPIRSVRRLGPETRHRRAGGLA